MNKREAEKLKVGDKVFAPGIGIYRNDPRSITKIISEHADLDVPVPLFTLEGEDEKRELTYLHLQNAE